MRLTALGQFTYAGRLLKAGDVFESNSDEDARLLKGWGRAEDGPQEKAKRNYKRRDMTAEDLI